MVIHFICSPWLIQRKPCQPSTSVAGPRVLMNFLPSWPPLCTLPLKSPWKMRVLTRGSQTSACIGLLKTQILGFHAHNCFFSRSGGKPKNLPSWHVPDADATGLGTTLWTPLVSPPSASHTHAQVWHPDEGKEPSRDSSLSHKGRLKL